MRYQVHIAKQLFKQKIYKVVIFLFTFFFLLILSEFLNPRETEQDTLYYLLGIFGEDKASFLETLWIAFQTVSIIYIFFLYLTYEEEHSPEFILLRSNYFSILKNKTIIFLIFLVIFRIVLFLLVTLSFNKYIYFSLSAFAVNIFFYIAVTILSLLYYIIFIHKKKI